MENKPLEKQILHLSEVEKLSMRQIAKAVGIGRKRVSRILKGLGAKPVVKPSLLEPYRNLIVHWYQSYPNLKAIQIYERLKPYGYAGSYWSVVEFSKAWRTPKAEAYHPLVFLPGEEAQIDWFFSGMKDLECWPDFSMCCLTRGMLGGNFILRLLSSFSWPGIWNVSSV